MLAKAVDVAVDVAAAAADESHLVDQVRVHMPLCQPGLCLVLLRLLHPHEFREFWTPKPRGPISMAKPAAIRKCDEGRN